MSLSPNASLEARRSSSKTAVDSDECPGRREDDHLVELRSNKHEETLMNKRREGDLDHAGHTSENRLETLLPSTVVEVSSDNGTLQLGSASQFPKLPSIDRTLSPLHKPDASIVAEYALDVDKEPRKVLPQELLSPNVVHLTCASSAKSGICDVYLVGTYHISEESCREVRDVISYLKPQVAFLELCSSRVSVLKPPKQQPPRSIDDAFIARLVNDILVNNRHDALWVLYGLLGTKCCAKLETRYGGEFYVASEEVKKHGGKVILGDRPIQVTYQRAWAKMPLPEKLKLTESLVSQLSAPASAEDLNKVTDHAMKYDYKTRVPDNTFPTYEETIVDERDQFMSCLLHKVASKHTSVVAVVGKGHLIGIEKYWKQPIQLDELLKVLNPVAEITT